MHQTVREFFLRPHDSVVKSYFQANLRVQPARSMIAITCIRCLDLHYGELVRWFGSTVLSSGFENSVRLVRYLNSRPFIKYSLEYLTQWKEDVNADSLTLKPFSDLIANLQNCPSSLEFCLLRWLIGFGTDPQHELQLNYLLGIAAKNGYYVTAGTLLAAGAECNDPVHTPLHSATEGEHEAIVCLLLDRGADIEARDFREQTPLHKAAECGHEAMVRLLLGRGSRIGTQDPYGGTPLHKAAESGYEATVRLLLDQGARIEAQDPCAGTPLHRAAGGGHEATVRLLLDRGAKIEAQDVLTGTPLHRAVGGEHEAIVRLLLDRGARIEAQVIRDGAPLHRAAGGGHEAMVRLLLDRKADVKARDSCKRTPLHNAAEGGHEAIVRLLLARGAEIEAKDWREWTPLHKAAELGQEAVVRLLLERGAHIKAGASRNRTPLHNAVEGGHEAVARLLLDRVAGVMTEAGDWGKLTPLLLQPPQPIGDECQPTAPPLFHTIRSSEVCGRRQWPGPSDILGSPAGRTWVFPSPGSAAEANKRVKLDDE